MNSLWNSCRGLIQEDGDSLIDYLYSYMAAGFVVRPSIIDASSIWNTRLQVPVPILASKQVMKDEWHFENGTVVVGPCTLSESCEKMLDTARNMKTFYASQMLEGLYEVQFTDELHPSVVVVVEADSGMQAGRLARHMLATDYAYHKVIEAERD
jgi:hypothetical protein